MLGVLLKIYKSEGLSGCYRGFGATMLNTFSQRAWPCLFVFFNINTHFPGSEYAYFFFYSFVRNSYITRLTRKLPPGSKLAPLSTVAELLLGALAGAIAQIFTIPVSVIATRQQVGRVDQTADTTERSDDSFFGVAREIVQEEGVTGLWLGIKPGLVLTVNPAITYGAFERVKSLIQIAQAKVGSNAIIKLSPLQSFLIGALSKTLATVVSFMTQRICYIT